MKKKSFVILWLSMLLLCACSSDSKVDVKDYYDNSKEINVNVTSSDILCFDMVFMTKEKVEKVEVLGVVGDGVEADTFEASAMNNTIDVYENHKHNNLYCSDWMFELKSNKKGLKCKINTIELKINDEIRNVKFEKPMEYINSNGNDIFNEELQVSSFANEFPSSMINSGDRAESQFIANKKMTIKKIETGTDLNINTKVFLDGDENTECTLPVEVEAGTKVNILMEYSSEKLNKFSYVSSNLLLTYSIDGKDYTRKGSIVFSPTSPVDEKLEKIDSLIDYIIK